MKILVIDDSPIHQAAAKAQLGAGGLGHDVTVVGTYDEGQKLLGGGDNHGCKKSGMHDFEVVLCDLLMPASGQMQGKRGRGYVGPEMPVGIFLALLAARNGAKYVAVLTDSDHHSHPASACFDAFNEHEDSPTPLRIGDAMVLLVNDSNLVVNDISVQPEVVERERLDGEKYEERVYPRIKLWGVLLEDYLLNPRKRPAPEMA